MAKLKAVEETQRIKNNINQFADELKGKFIGKDEEIDMMMVAAVAGEPLLFVGEPGTAKSDMVIKFIRMLNLEAGEGDYFEYMLTRFTEPSEIIGPVDILKLKNQGEFIRNTSGKLPEARVVFLDEVFKANSAILNVLLTIINEKKYYQGGRPRQVPLELLFAATNSVSVEDDLKALKDRFTLKVKTRPVNEESFKLLIEKGLKNESKAVEAVQYLSFDDFLVLRQHLARNWSNPEKDWKDNFANISSKVIGALATFKNEFNLFISDRKVIKIYKLLRTHAFMKGNGEVTESDLKVLKFIGEQDEDFERLSNAVHEFIDHG